MEVIFAAVATALVQFVKTKLKTGEYGSLGLIVLVSLAAAGIYTWLNYAGYWETFTHILVIAGAIYTFIVKRFTEGSALRTALGF